MPALETLAFAGSYSEQALQRGITPEQSDMTVASIPYKLLPQWQKPIYDAMRVEYADLYARLENAGFLLDFGAVPVHQAGIDAGHRALVEADAEAGIDERVQPHQVFGAGGAAVEVLDVEREEVEVIPEDVLPIAGVLPLRNKTTDIEIQGLLGKARRGSEQSGQHKQRSGNSETTHGSPRRAGAN